MRTRSATFLLFTVAALPSGLAGLPSARAAAPACGGDRVKDCFVGEVFLLDPESVGPGDKPLVDARTCTSPRRPIGNDDRSIAADLCTQYALGGAANGADVVTAAWGKLRAAGVEPKVDQVVLFSAEYAVGWDPQFFREGDANTVDGIGLPRKDPTAPYLGWITFGSTTPMDNANVRRTKLECATGTCARAFHTPLDALAQTTANLHAPYAAGPDAMRPLAVHKENKPARPVWNAWLDLKGSPLGGNNWRDNGNGTLESAGDPPLLFGVIPPYDGQRMMRFAPIDLYLMGLMSRADLDRLQPAVKIHNGARMLRGTAATDNEYMGRKAGVIVEPRANPDVKPADFLAGLPERAPAFAMAPRHVRQVWILLGRPGVDAKKNLDAAAKLEAQRLQFGVYHGVLTAHRGRVITRVDGADDGGLFEFPVDSGDPERRAFEKLRLAGGLVVKHVEEPARADAPETISALDVTSPGANGAFTIEGFGDARLGFAPEDVNMVTLRVRTTVAELRAFVAVNDGAMVQVPSGAKAHLIADGAWHLYGASVDPAGKPVTSVTIVPASAAVPAGELQIDSVRVMRSSKSRDGDRSCTVPGSGAKATDTPDGFIDEVDNCPQVANADQSDADGNGIGDACEDLDGDSIPNGCDNCPLVANLDQADSDGNRVGDRCDASHGGRAACFLFPYSVAGRLDDGAPAALWIAAAVAGVVALRRRRRRGDSR